MSAADFYRGRCAELASCAGSGLQVDNASVKVDIINNTSSPPPTSKKRNAPGLVLVDGDGCKRRARAHPRQRTRDRMGVYVFLSDLKKFDWLGIFLKA